MSLNPKEIAPHSLHALNFNLKELNPIKTKSNNKIGIRNRIIRMLPKKLIKKLIPKIGIIISAINENVKIVLLTLRKEVLGIKVGGSYLENLLKS